MDHLVGLEGGWRDCGLCRGVGRLAGQAQHHGGGLLRGLEVGRHEGVLRVHGGLDGRGHTDDGRLCRHTVVEGGRLGEGVGVGHEAGLAHCCHWTCPCWT